ncbi:MAG: hypothetical protein QG630_477 [Patescibacteria group bacterium]|nr:hypothetical protein [Patescibacteria group bacterium]
MKKVSIIIPAYKRPKELIRAAESVLTQKHKDWEIIIINDSPDFDFTEFDIFLQNLSGEYKPKIKYFINTKNMGANYSRNFGLDNLSKNSDFVFFLDHDDWLKENSLADQVSIIQREKCDWLLTLNKSNGIELGIDSIKITDQDKRYYNYLIDYLIKRKIRGDYAQLLKTDLIKKHNIYYSKKVNSGQTLEEWVFSIRYSRYSKCFVENIVTLEKEYQQDSLTNLAKNKKFKNKLNNFKNIFFASSEIFFEGVYPMEKVYIFIKILRGIQKLIF